MYTEEETEKLKEIYLAQPNMDGVRAAVAALGKPQKSVIGKLSRMGIYKRITYVSKTGEAPITKLELVAQVAEAIGISREKLNGLEKAPKLVLKALIEKVKDETT